MSSPKQKDSSPKQEYSDAITNYKVTQEPKPRSKGNEPIGHFTVKFEKSERSAKPSADTAKMFTRVPKKYKGLTFSSKNSSTNKKIPLTSTRNKITKINFSGDGSKTVDTDRTGIFSQENQYFRDLNEKEATKTAENNESGNVKRLIEQIEKRKSLSKKGGKKTRKNKKSKKSKTRSKRR